MTMILTKTISIGFVAVLLYPVARTFYEMCLFEKPAEVEELPENFPPPETSDDSGKPSFGIMATQIHYVVSPFENLNRFLAYGPRRWVGFLGLASTALILALLIFSAVFHVEGPFHSYEWKDEVGDLGDESKVGSIIQWRFNEDGTFTLGEEGSNEDGPAKAPPP